MSQYAIRNKTKGPVQLIVRSFSDRREHSKAFTVKNIPGLSEIILKEEQVVDKYLKQNEKWGLLSFRKILDKEEIRKVEEI